MVHATGQGAKARALLTKNIYAPLFSASTPFSGQACVGGTWARSRARERCAPCLRRQGGATHGAPYDAISFIHRSIGFSCSSVEAKRNQTRRDRAEGEVREEEGKKEREKERKRERNKETKKQKKNTKKSDSPLPSRGP